MPGITFNAMALKPLKTKFALVFCFVLVVSVVEIFIPHMQKLASEYHYAKRLTVVDKAYLGSLERKNTIPGSDKLRPRKTFDKKNAPAAILQKSAMELTSDNLATELDGNIYGIGCPPNPYRPALRYLFHTWASLTSLHNISSFLCAGSLIGLARNGDIIPYDRDIDMCMSDKEYLKLQQLETPKPFNYRDGGIYLAIQRDFFSKDPDERTRVDCRGRQVAYKNDPCSFVYPGARLIYRGRWLDVFVFLEKGKHMNDVEYKAVHLLEDIFPLKPCVFMGIGTNCPHNQTSLLLRYFEPDVLTKPHYVCRNKTWLPTSSNVKEKFKIRFPYMHN